MTGIKNRKTIMKGGKFMKKNRKGFTLIELLVVIAIIGILSTLSVLALNSARARARDAKRISDIRQITTALEMYYNLNDNYPSTTTALTTSTPPLLRVMPIAPIPADGTCLVAQNTYTYTHFPGTAGAGSSTYSLTYCLGAATGGIAGGINTATPSGISSK
jgi:prepilin-type N-terminal cleavage/methylation domain-containing protein